MSKILKDPNFDQNRISSIPHSIYVTRIPSTVDNKSMLQYFSSFGQVKEAYIAKRKNGRHSGYGYAIAENSRIYKILLETEHTIDGRKLIVLPFTNENGIKQDSNNYSKRKICISKVPHVLTPSILQEFFRGYGELDNFFEIAPPKNQSNKRSLMPLSMRKYSYQVVFKKIESASLFSDLGDKLDIMGLKVSIKTFIEDKNSKDLKQSDSISIPPPVKSKKIKIVPNLEYQFTNQEDQKFTKLDQVNSQFYHGLNLPPQNIHKNQFSSSHYTNYGVHQRYLINQGPTNKGNYPQNGVEIEGLIHKAGTREYDQTSKHVHHTGQIAVFSRRENQEMEQFKYTHQQKKQSRGLTKALKISCGHDEQLNHSLQNIRFNQPNLIQTGSRF